MVGGRASIPATTCCWSCARDRAYRGSDHRRDHRLGVVVRERRDGDRGAQRRVLAEHQRTARPFVRDLRRAVAAGRAGRTHSGAPRFAAVGLAPVGGLDRRERRNAAAGRSVGRQRSVSFGHAPQRRHGDPADFRRRRDLRLCREQSASHRRRRNGSRFDAARSARSLRRRLRHAADALDARRSGGERNGRSVSRQLAHARDAQRRSARAAGRQRDGRAARARARRAVRGRHRGRRHRQGDRRRRARGCAPRCAPFPTEPPT